MTLLLFPSCLCRHPGSLSIPKISAKLNLILYFHVHSLPGLPLNELDFGPSRCYLKSEPDGSGFCMANYIAKKRLLDLILMSPLSANSVTPH
ncbi:hypothetical protein RO3G_12828 [Rhizopus delemar RA 99-880]|uniref:Uncharacterized protein n=1 Tax=Rhizopus delemar (strain RA 99-880 / ATCC MYA-4621 / FGSC 9543 / NRRL 43880) TaxID=246409 RepID=I1CI37_RHIO9|nr:hypothetical protein RO3G_12828 [Rhizopus delemar RA 99-880]|eukprot:EIE88117.1 hypothetical protein RO3G_12828 [Rhizopus delemar RA 99-880]